MICPACCANTHEGCDDVVRHEKYVAWLHREYRDKKITVGQTELATIRANQPYNSCCCQHKTKEKT